MDISVTSLRRFGASASSYGVSRRVLTQRYVLAVFIIGVVLLGQHGLAGLQAGKYKSDGTLINISGLQRMLSQRVAMLGVDVTSVSNDYLRTRRVQKLAEAVSSMDRNQALLREDWTRRAAAGETRFAALLGDGCVAERTENFLSLAREVLQSTAGTEVERRIGRDTALSLSAIARGDFLTALNEVVTLYERNSQTSLSRLQQAGTLAILIGFLVLLAVSLLIFRPMVDLVVSTIDSLRDSRDEQYELGRRMSHDLRSPIASSLGVLSILEDSLDQGDVDDVKDMAGRLGGELSRLDGVLARLMAVTRLHRVSPQLEPCDLGELVTEVLGARAVSEDVVVDNRLTAPVLADRSLLRGILEALFDNAVDFRQGERAEIRVMITSLRNEVRLCVDDQGLGIPEACRSRVFDMFQRFHPERSTGAGLGLYLAKVSARTLSGRLAYQPLPAGSRFVLSLPC